MATEDVISGSFIRCTYDSLDELAAAAKRRIGGDTDRTSARDYGSGRDWTLGVEFDAALEMARTGWTEQLDDALSIAESAVALCEREHDVMTPVMTYDVTGDYVDIGRYVTGEPECMVDYPLEPISKVGKVITVCVGGFYSAAMDAESLVLRGQVITALCIALARLGHNVEIWSDIAGQGHGEAHYSIRTLVKGVNDEIDPAKILLAFAHPLMFRRLGFAVMDGFKGGFAKRVGALGGYYSSKDKVRRDLPEGTIYLEGVSTSVNIPDAHEALKGYLRDLGLLAE